MDSLVYSLWFFEELLELIGISRGVHLDLSNGNSITVCGVFLIPRFLFVINNGSRLMQAKELDMGMELNLHKTLCHFLVAQLQVELNLDKTLCHFLVAQLQDLEPNVSRKH
jgi:hypothetical protein